MEIRGKRRWLAVLLLFSLLSPLSLLAKREGRGVEVRYPHIPGLTEPPRTVKAALPKTARYLFEILIVLSGLACFAALFSAGIRISTSLGNPKAIQEAKNDIENVVLGLLLVFGAYLLSKTVNPQLVTPQVRIEVLNGVSFFEDSMCRFNEDKEEMNGKGRLVSNNGNLKKAFGFKPQCLKFADPEANLDLLLYKKPGFKERLFHLPARVGQAGFGQGIGSVRFLWRYPGLYLCPGEYRKERGEWFCSDKEKLLSRDTEMLSTEIKNQVGGLKFETVLEKGVEDASWCEKQRGVLREGNCVRPYGVVLHQKADRRGKAELIDPVALREEDFMYFAKDLEGENPTFREESFPEPQQEGECSPENEGLVWCLSGRSYLKCSPEAGPPEETKWLKEMCPEEKTCCGTADRCQGDACLDSDESPAKVSQPGKEPSFNLENTSSITLFSPLRKKPEGGVYFCQEPDPGVTEQPNCYGPYKKIKGTLGGSPIDEYTTETLEALPNAKHCAAEWTGLGNGISSLVVNGNFLVVLFGKNDFKGEAQVFRESDFNLLNDPIGACCGIRTDCVSSLIVIPIRGSRKPMGEAPSTIPSCKDQCTRGDMVCNAAATGYKMCGDYDEDDCLDWPEDFTLCPEAKNCTGDPEDPCGMGGPVCTEGETRCISGEPANDYEKCISQNGNLIWEEKECSPGCYCCDNEDESLCGMSCGEGPCYSS